MLGSGLLLLAGNLTIGVLMLARNILIANFISVEHYGIAMTFAITITLIEVAFNLMVDVYVVKSEDGDAPETLPMLHAIMAFRGVFNGLLLYLLAPLIAGLFKAPEYVWAYQVMAILSLLRGFNHLDMFRLQRHGRFRPKVLVETGAFVASLIAAYIAVLIWGDFRAMLGALFAQWVTFFILSHVVAERRFSIGWDGSVFRAVFLFGWPLLLNAWLIFPIQNGDRIIVGNQLGPEVLGWFSAAFMLAQTPAMLLTSAPRTLFLPTISKTGPGQARAHQISLEVTLFLGIAFAVGTVIAGPFFLTLLFGERYTQAVPVILWLGLIFGLRIARGGLVTSAIGEGQTKAVLIGSLSRVVALPLAWWLLHASGSMNQFMALLVGAEMISFVVSLWLVRREARSIVPGLIITGLVGGATSAVMFATAPVLSTDLRFEPLQWALLLGLAGCLVFLPALRGWISEEIFDRKITS